MGGHRQLAVWLIARRTQIEGILGERRGGLPAPDSAEAETLRRFRSFATAALSRGHEAAPALDGLRVNERRAGALLDAWLDAVAEASGPDGEEVRRILAPTLARFRGALRATVTVRRASGAPRASNRRAVSAAIDRVADAFLAIDIDTAHIADANPAAGALLGTTRDRLLGSCAMSFLPEPARDLWWTQLDALAEGGEPRRFRSTLRDQGGDTIEVEVSLTRFATRARTLALAVARPAGTPVA